MLWGEELNSELQLAAVTGNGQTRDKCETPLHSSNYGRKYPATSRVLKLSWSESGVRPLLCVEEDRHDNAAIDTTHKHGSTSSGDDEDDGVDVSRGECAGFCDLFWKGSVLLLWVGGTAQLRVLFAYTVSSRCVVAGFSSDLFQYHSLCVLLGSVCLITHLLEFVRIFLFGEVTPSGALASVSYFHFRFSVTTTVSGGVVNTCLYLNLSYANNVFNSKKKTAKRTWLLCVSESQCVECLGLSVTPLRQSSVWGSEPTVIQREKQHFTPNWGFKWLFIQVYVTTLSVSPPTGADGRSAPVRPAHSVWGPWPVLQNVWTRYENTPQSADFQEHHVRKWSVSCLSPTLRQL